MDDVDRTLALWRSTPFLYGKSDCMLSIGRYVALCGGPDVTHRFTGRYKDHEGAVRKMRTYGGVPGLMHLVGAEPIDGPPERGDVVELVGDSDAIGALCTGGMVAARLERGVIEIALRLARIGGVWRIHRVMG